MHFPTMGVCGVSEKLELHILWLFPVSAEIVHLLLGAMGATNKQNGGVCTSDKPTHFFKKTSAAIRLCRLLRRSGLA